ncbi:hypothetical protein HPB48_001266 [Haemaphysalis longicornis]|uniref:Uncharacterized protein n=1 Tax=Haemaphysalis longicornis TaxID=44386 RepID=A0A9J6FHZ4_HAELO|nr:hypothetical protein HPB48_001266 [Haemaphysalis longicornis]
MGKKVPFMVYVGGVETRCLPLQAHGRPLSRVPQDRPQSRRVPAPPINAQMQELRRSTDFGPARVPALSVLSAEAPIQRQVSHVPRGSYHRSTAEREEAHPRTPGVPAHCPWMLAKGLQTPGPNPGTGETVPRHRPKAERNQDVAPDPDPSMPPKQGHEAPRGESEQSQTTTSPSQVSWAKVASPKAQPPLHHPEITQVQAQNARLLEEKCYS